ncbi:Ku protein [Streptomyces sp. NPDC004629]|uniref:Ku protein n=1 Tax=Streptomyces sp. NPDC004629 TaxID=3364705 RepID=UPI00368A9698
MRRTPLRGGYEANTVACCGRRQPGGPRRSAGAEPTHPWAAWHRRRHRADGGPYLQDAPRHRRAPTPETLGAWRCATPASTFNGNRYWCEAEDREVTYGETGRGYVMPDGRGIPVTEEELRSLPLTTARAIELVAFIPAPAVDPLRIGAGYYLQPQDAVAAKPYVPQGCGLVRGETPSSAAGPRQPDRCVNSADLLIDLHVQCAGSSWWALACMVETRSAFDAVSGQTSLYARRRTPGRLQHCLHVSRPSK